MNEEKIKTTLIQGDCIKIMKDFPDESIDHIITDFDFDYIPTDDLLKEFNRVLKKDAWICFWFPFKHLKEYVNQFSKYFQYVWMINHIKYNSGKFCPVGYSKTESILIFKKGNPKINTRIDDAIIHPVHQIGEHEHPFQKDICVVTILVKSFTKEGDIVLDPFMGTGTTIIACENLGRNGIGIEINENYYKIAEERLTKVIKQNRVGV